MEHQRGIANVVVLAVDVPADVGNTINRIHAYTVAVGLAPPFRRSVARYSAKHAQPRSGT